MKKLLILILFCTVTFIFFYPVFINFSSHIASFYSTDEPYGVIWSFWWLKYAFLNHISSNLINIIAYPFGILTNSVSFFPLWGLIVKCITILSNEIIAYNSVLLSTFILSGLTMYLLMFYLTKNTAASIFSGLIYSFCPFHIVRFWQHFGTAQIQWLPLYFLILFKLWQEKKTKYGLWLGFVFALNYYFDTHYGYFLVIISVPITAYILFTLDSKRKKFEFLKTVVLAGLIATVLIIPAFLPVLKNIGKVGQQIPSVYSFVRPFEDLFVQSARPLSYFLPFTEQPFFGRITSMFIGTDFWGRSLTEHNIFLGYIPLFLCIVAVLRRKYLIALIKDKAIDIKRILQCCFLITILGWLCSQPPWWNFFGLKIYMPSYLFYKIFPMFRAYVRFGIVVMLGVSILAGCGLIIILDRFKSLRVKISILILVCFLSLFEFWSNPNAHTMDLSKYPKVYDWLKSQPADSVIAEYPLDIIGPGEIYKFYQTKHHMMIINGTIPGTYAHKFSEALTQLSSEKTSAILKWMGVKFVLVHIDDYKNSEICADAEETTKIRKVKGLKYINNFEDIEVYEVIAEPLEPEIQQGRFSQ